MIHRSDHDVGAAVSVEIVYSDDLYEVEGGRLPNQLVISVLRHRASPGEDEQVDFRIFVEIGCEEGTRLEATAQISLPIGGWRRDVTRANGSPRSLGVVTRHGPTGVGDTGKRQQDQRA